MTKMCIFVGDIFTWTRW